MSITKVVLITGVSGQDGSYMADYLLANTSHRIYGMIRRTAKPDYDNMDEALKNPRFSLVVGDLSDAHSIDTLVKDLKPDYFINFAAQSFVGSSWTLGEQTIDITGTGVYRCLEAIRKHAPQCRFYSAGSSEEFGAVEYSPQDEKHPLRPQSPYGAAKCLAGYLVRVYRQSYGLYAIHGKLFNHESPRRGEEFVTRKITKGVARIARAIKDGVPFDPIELGNLDAKRDWSHAADFVDGVWRMLNQNCTRAIPIPDAEFEFDNELDRKTYDEQEKTCEAWHPSEYVLASNETHTVREFISAAFFIADIDPTHWEGIDQDEKLYWINDDRSWLRNGGGVPGELLVRINPAFYRPADVDLLWGDSTRARTELGWAPKYSFDDLVEAMVRADLAEVGL